MKHKRLSTLKFGSAAGVLVSIALLALVGCVPLTRPPNVSPPPLQVVPQSPGPSSQAPLPGLIVTDIEGKKEPKKLYSFSLRDADVRDVLMAVSRQTDFNIVVAPDVQGRLTVDLKNVTLREALDTITDTLNLNYRVTQNIIRVSKPEPETRLFSLQYVNLRRAASSSTSAQIGAAGAVTGGTTGAVAAPGVVSTPGSVGATGIAAGAGGQTTVATLTDTDLWKDIEAGVKRLLSPSPEAGKAEPGTTVAGKMAAGTIVVDKQSSNILVTDYPKILDRIAAFLESVEGSIQRQVLIEAKVLEVTLTGDYRFGIDWSAVAKIASDAGTLSGTTTISSVTPRIFAQKLAPAESNFQIGVTSSDFQALLAVLNKQGEVNVISSPKLATLNNQTAVIRSATDEVFFEPRVVTIPTSTTPLVTTDVTTRTVTIGVVLSVTPQISSDGSIVLHIRPTVTDTTRRETFTQQATSTTGAFNITVPVVDVREADVIVRAREGQVVVIGGLMQERKSDEESKVPILGDLPGIGRLFRSTTQIRKKTELVVLLSPTVMVGKKIDEITSRELERLNKAKGASPW